MAANRAAQLLLGTVRAKPNAAAAAAPSPVLCRLLSPRPTVAAAALPRRTLVLLPSPPATGTARSALARNGTDRLLRGCAPGLHPAAAGHRRPRFGGGPSPARAFSASPLPRGAAALAPAAVGPAEASAETAGRAAEAAASAAADAPLPPLAVGDLADMGLASCWTPVGHIQNLIEWIACATGLPFWAVIPLSLAAYKLAILPALKPAIQSSERYAHVMPVIAPLTQKLRQAGIDKHAGKQNQAAAAVQQMFAVHNISNLWLAAAPIIESACSLSGIWAVREIINLPVPQLADQSVFWIQDLTAADPTHTLPFAVAASVIFMNEWKRVYTAVSPSVGKNQLGYSVFVDLFPILTIPLCWNVSSGVLFAALSTSVVYNLQNVIVALPAVRRALDIPLRSPVHPSLRRKRIWTLLAEMLRATRLAWSPKKSASR